VLKAKHHEYYQYTRCILIKARLLASCILTNFDVITLKISFVDNKKMCNIASQFKVIF